MNIPSAHFYLTYSACMETDSSLVAVKTMEVNVLSLKPSLALNIFSIIIFTKKIKMSNW